MAHATCTGCGAPIDIAKSAGGVVECAYCHRKNTVPKSASADAVNFLAIGEHALMCGKFDEAYAACKRASELDENESEAYFGMALAEFGVRYIKDEVNNGIQPICHKKSDKSFTANADYLAAIECASPEQAELYAERAEEIEHIRREFFEFENGGLDYDCFICAKLTDGDGNRTKDYKTADDIYWYLKNNGYKPFFSEYDVKDRTGADYEALICYALYASECMIIVCGDEEYLKTPWVKNEYMRFIELIDDEQKERDAVCIAFNGKPVERLPGRGGKLQGVDISTLGAAERIAEFVSSHISASRRKGEARATGVVAENRPKASAAAVQSLLTRAKRFLQSGSHNIARDHCIRALDADPENSEAWFLLLLAERQVGDIGNCVHAITSKIRSIVDIDSLTASATYVNAKKYSREPVFVTLDAKLADMRDRFSARDGKRAERETAATKRPAKLGAASIIFICVAAAGVALYASTLVMDLFYALFGIYSANTGYYIFFTDNPAGTAVIVALVVVGVVGFIASFFKSGKK